MSFKEIIKVNLNYLGLLSAFPLYVVFFCEGRKAEAERKQIINRELEEKLFPSVVWKKNHPTVLLLPFN